MPDPLFSYPALPSPSDLLRVHPDMDPRFVECYTAAVDFTMTSPERMYSLWGAIRYVVEHDISGAFVECGVWRGGSAMIAALSLLQLRASDRELWLYDTFEGMPRPAERDVDFAGSPAGSLLIGADEDDLVRAYASEVEVRANLARTGYPDARMHLVAGKVEDTIPAHTPDRIAVLRLDTDWEASTRHELEHLWPRLEAGGIIIVDDYGHWRGARHAVDEYFARRQDAPLLVRVDYTGRVGVKQQT